MMQITKMSIAVAVTRLVNAGFSLKRNMTAEGYVEEAFSRLNDGGSKFTEEHLSAGVSRVINDAGDWFPTVGQLRDAMRLAMREEGKRAEGPRDWNAHPEGPCPTCGAILEALEPERQLRMTRDPNTGEMFNDNTPGHGPMFGYLHDLEKHERAGVAIVGQFWT